jgi:hypothetical protein
MLTYDELLKRGGLETLPFSLPLISFFKDHSLDPTYLLLKAVLEKEEGWISTLLLHWPQMDKGRALHMAYLLDFSPGVLLLEDTPFSPTLASNRYYLITGDLDRVDLSLSDPLSEVDQDTFERLAPRIPLSWGKYLPTMNAEESYYGALGDKEILTSLLDQEEILIDGVLPPLLRCGHYSLARELAEEYEGKADNIRPLERALGLTQDLGAFSFFDPENLDIHQAMKEEDWEKMQGFLDREKDRTLSVVFTYYRWYEGGFPHDLDCPCCELLCQGTWPTSPPPSSQGELPSLERLHTLDTYDLSKNILPILEAHGPGVLEVLYRVIREVEGNLSSPSPSWVEFSIRCLLDWGFDLQETKGETFKGYRIRLPCVDPKARVVYYRSPWEDRRAYREDPWYVSSEVHEWFSNLRLWMYVHHLGWDEEEIGTTDP